jgi:hypothetical protein
MALTISPFAFSLTLWGAFLIYVRSNTTQPERRRYQTCLDYLEGIRKQTGSKRVRVEMDTALQKRQNKACLIIPMIHQILSLDKRKML